METYGLSINTNLYLLEYGRCTLIYSKAELANVSQPSSSLSSPHTLRMINEQCRKFSFTNMHFEILNKTFAFTTSPCPKHSSGLRSAIYQEALRKITMSWLKWTQWQELDVDFAASAAQQPTQNSQPIKPNNANCKFTTFLWLWACN